MIKREVNSEKVTSSSQIKSTGTVDISLTRRKSQNPARPLLPTRPLRRRRNPCDRLFPASIANGQRLRRDRLNSAIHSLKSEPQRISVYGTSHPDRNSPMNRN